MKIKPDKTILLITCPDQQGIVAKISSWLFNLHINIISMEEHVENSPAFFFMRVVTESNEFILSNEKLKNEINKFENEFYGKISIYHSKIKDNCAIFVTKEDLPLYDLLIKNQKNNFNYNIKMIVSNHEKLSNVAKQFNIPFYYFPVNSTNKLDLEPKIIQLMKSNNIDLIVLARYMQILSPNFIEQFEQKIINIHHGFLPAFKGGRPYHQAWKRGVKIIGATAHYVTNNLDEGPIITQDVIPINHTFSATEMIQAGKDIERRVLTHAVQAHTDKRIIVHEGRTIVFNR
ncbi:MAG: formyltetrahydrofolate deformylase [Candidatus Marinimicrobia bacterium]|nr:formyltetrahydrofolate deformylase [Candidatus Neomarinimicrobiota bacterium]